MELFRVDSFGGLQKRQQRGRQRQNLKVTHKSVSLAKVGIRERDQDRKA